MSKQYLSTDPRDRVFALLGLYNTAFGGSRPEEHKAIDRASERGPGCEGGEEGEENGLDFIRPDYDSSPIQLFRQTVLHCLHQSRELSILGFAGWSEPDEPICDRIDNDDLSSWVPRWDLPRPIQLYLLIIDISTSQEDHGSVQARSRLYHYACGDESMDRKPNPDPALLVLRGIQTDKIAECTRPYHYEEECDRKMSSLPEMWLKFAAWKHLEADCNDEELEDLARTVHEALKPWAPKRDSKSGVLLWHPQDSPTRGSIETLMKSTLLTIIAQLREPERKELLTPDQEAYDMCMRIYHYLVKSFDIKRIDFVAFATTNIGRAFFVTESERIGIGSSRLSKGDELFVLFGGPLLYALRPCRAEFHLAGAAHIRQFARGEAVNEWRKGEREAVWVRIR